MIKGLTEYEKIKVVRPLFSERDYDFKMPVLYKITENDIDVENMEPIGIQNLSMKYNNSSRIVMPFVYDKFLEKYWENPMKYIPLFQTTMVVCTLDYSVYPSMNYYEVAHNVYKNRWLGCLWQDYGCKVIPSVSWALPDTYDVCFSAIPKGNIVAISTLGCDKNRDVFLEGYSEMMNRIEPSLVIVYGDMMDGMYGRFINYRYTDVFNDNKGMCKQIVMEGISPIFIRKRGE